MVKKNKEIMVIYTCASFLFFDGIFNRVLDSFSGESIEFQF